VQRITAIGFLAVLVLIAAAFSRDGSESREASAAPLSVQPGSAFPANLALPDGHFAAFQVDAEGVQIYLCQARTNDPMAFEWAFRFPEAVLINTWGETIGTHYAGPTWESRDGSLVVAAARANADSPDATAIPWLLLQAQSTSGTGVFSTVSYIQRIDTTGGRAPASCDAATAGQELRVPYTAVYAFAYPASSVDPDTEEAI
jgi:hypothetical protein